MKKKAKVIWKIQNDGDGFYMVDQDGTIVWPISKGQSFHKMFEYAIEHGADEVNHAYDCVKYRT